MLFPATESQGIFPSPAWPTALIRGRRSWGRCPSGNFGSGYAGMRNMQAGWSEAEPHRAHTPC